MELSLIAEDASQKGKISVDDAVFGCDYNETLVHQIVTAYQAAARTGNSAQKTRSEVSGGGAKPWRQKGTGRARAGTTRGPIWRGGGVTFASKPRSYAQKVNKKMYRAAIKSILSELCRQERLIVIEGLSMEEPSTKQLSQKLSAMNITNALILVDGFNDNLYLSARNIPHVDVLEVTGVDPVSLVAYEKVVVTSSIIKHFEEWLQ